MDVQTSLIIFLSGYLIGSVSFTRIVGKLVLPGENMEYTTVQVEGTDDEFSFRSVSATTIRARAGAKYGIITSILDISKATIPVFVASRYLDSPSCAFLMSLSVIFGHDFPVYHRFRGGRGVSCLWGSLLVFNWTTIPITSVLSMGIGLFVIDDAFVAYLSTPIYLIPWALIFTGISQFSVYAIAVNAIYWVALIPELREYMKFRGTDAYKKAKKARHERTKKRISQVLSRLGIGKK
jgi:glycerol-3-phosphate acyltransferase PlsY